MTTVIHTFGAFAEEYDRFRPDYPEALWDHFGLAEGSRVADLGAGTGRASLALAERGLRVTAIEPDPGMAAIARAQAARRSGAIAVVEASAEHPGLGGDSQDAVVAAQSYHWFETPEANQEVARILKPDGFFAVFWNDRRVDGDPFLEAFETLITKYNPSHRREYRDFDVAARLREGECFADVVAHEFDFDWEVDIQKFRGFARTLSYVRNEVTTADLGRFESEVATLVKDHYGRDPFVVPLTTRVWIARLP